MVPLYHLFRVTPMPPPMPSSPRPKPVRGSTDEFLRSWGFSIVARPGSAVVTWKAASGEVLATAEAIHVSGGNEAEARARTLQEKLQAVKDGMRAGVAELYGIHPDDLGGEG